MTFGRALVTSSRLLTDQHNGKKPDVPNDLRQSVRYSQKTDGGGYTHIQQGVHEERHLAVYHAYESKN